MAKSFLNSEKSLLTAMVQGETPERIKYLMDKCREEGAEAFGMQFERLLPEYKTKEIIEDLFAYAGELPVYFTNYRYLKNEGKSDDTLAEEIVEYANLGGTLCDITGDLFDKTDDQVTTNEEAIKKQMELIDKLHGMGKEVLMSSHVLKFTDEKRVLEIAMEHKRRGADISKIVVSASNMKEQIENLRITAVLKEKMDIPFLFLSGGECRRISRRLGGALGNCMTLTVHEYDELATPAQPLLSDMKIIRELIKA